ncbi:hypothetical protein DAPPUDRAFT_239959 [Daphnia pulex]|uniref:Uncharacterized protein n=1 Tax=Daphnia pulex TaxID=6669 RepID=E9GAI2_DAPPU|nr:hypothetical protein DAPPUDRAFT_239959 [Daphnia pulex]|eukprot:EFX83522.1 hypothetical protein DAPPUDRAFT_239959 [Daphnia pulex]
MIYIPRFDSFNMASFFKKISPTSWLSLAAVVLIVASAIGMIFIDQINRSKLEECNKRIGCSSSLNPQFAEMKTDASLIRAVPDDNFHRNYNSAQELPPELFKRVPFRLKERKLLSFPKTEIKK